MAEMIDLPVLGDWPTRLDVGSPMCQLLLPFDGDDAVAVQVQAVFPNHAMPEWREGEFACMGTP